MLSNRHPALLQGGLALATLLIAVTSLCLGQYPLGLGEVFRQLGHLSPADGVAGQIVWSVRLPRVVMALLAGGALGLCGATLQGVFQNPLVDPHIIGVTSGSAFGGTLAILLGLDTLLMMASTFGFGLLARLLGSFATANWHKVLLMALPIIAAATILYRLRWRINLLALEDKDARGLGVSVTALRRSVLVCCAVLVAAQVAVSGSIAWVGLVIPHLARLLVGADHRRLLPTAFWLGGGFMVVVDSLARTLTQAEIPIGIITALLGAPLFSWLLFHSRRRGTV